MSRSRYELPPLRRIRKKLWLPPKVWLQAASPRRRDAGSLRNGQQAARLSWLAVNMRWVLTTPLGRPVEPEVNSTLAMVSGPSAAKARSHALDRGVSRIPIPMRSAPVNSSAANAGA